MAYNESMTVDADALEGHPLYLPDGTIPPAHRLNWGTLFYNRERNFAIGTTLRGTAPASGNWGARSGAASPTQLHFWTETGSPDLEVTIFAWRPKEQLRLDSRYIKDVLQRADQDSVGWTPIADHLRETYGFQPLLIDLFLCFLCQRDHRALQEIHGEVIEVRIGMPQTTLIRLQRGSLVSAADWHRLRDLGNQLLEEPRPPAHRSLQGQDRFASSLRTKGQAKRTVLQGLHSRLVHLGADQGERLKELSTANSRLAALAQTTTDSYKVLTELLAAWPDDASDELRTLVQQAESIRDALGEVNEHARNNLKAGVNHVAIGTEVSGHLSALDGRLGAAQAEQPLTKDWVSTWNKKGAGVDQASHRAAPRAAASCSAATAGTATTNSAERGDPQSALRPTGCRRHLLFPRAGSEGPGGTGGEANQRGPRS